METLAQALARVAALSVSRAARLLAERLSGLPANLSPHAPTRSGYAPLLKTAEALLQEISHRALPAPFELRFAADAVEDDLTNAPLSARKARESLGHLRQLVAIEFLVAAQATELTGVERLGRGTAAALRTVRALVPPLDEDRPHGPDVELLEREALGSGRMLAEIQAAL
jgi:histidine ammonia-lyase